MSLAVDGLGFARPGLRVLHGVGFTLEPGQVLAVAGPNGVGKTTLIRLLMGALRPNQGRVTLNGRPLGAYTERELAAIMAYVPQGVAGVFPMRVFDLALLGRRPHLAWRPRRRDLERAAWALWRLGVDDLAERDARQLSGGQLQKVLLARALAQDTPFVLLDEPVSGLDLRHQLEVMEILRELARNRRCAVLASLHDVNLAARYADRVLLLNKGRPHGFGPPGEVLDEKALRAVFGVEAARVRAQGREGFLPIRPVR